MKRQISNILTFLAPIQIPAFSDVNTTGQTVSIFPIYNARTSNNDITVLLDVIYDVSYNSPSYLRILSFGVAVSKYHCANICQNQFGNNQLGQMSNGIVSSYDFDSSRDSPNSCVRRCSNDGAAYAGVGNSSCICGRNFDKPNFVDGSVPVSCRGDVNFPCGDTSGNLQIYTINQCEYLKIDLSDEISPKFQIASRRIMMTFRVRVICTVMTLLPQSLISHHPKEKDSL